MFDTIEKIEGALLHHGQANNRVYLMQADHTNWDRHMHTMKELAIEKEYDKIIGVFPEEAKEEFLSQGYHLEAKIPGLYNGTTTGYFLADFLNNDRNHCDEQRVKIMQSVKTIALAANNSSKDSYLVTPDDFEIRKLVSEDVGVLSAFNRKIFKEYAFPIFEKSFILNCMQNDHEFYGLFEKGELVVTADLKINKEESYVEIIDFATLPSIEDKTFRIT